RGQVHGDIGEHEVDPPLTGRHRGVGVEVVPCPGRRCHRRATVALPVYAAYRIRVFGDPVLKQKAAEITDVDGALARLADDMIETLYDAAGLGLAAPQVGVQKRLFVYDLHDDEGPKVIVNPTISEARGEWT